MDKDLLIKAELAYGVSIHSVVSSITLHVDYCNYTLNDVEERLNTKIDEGYEDINGDLRVFGLRSLSYVMKQTNNKQYVSRIKSAILYCHDEALENLDNCINIYALNEFNKLPEDMVIAVKEQIRTHIKLQLKDTLSRLYKEYSQRYH